MSIKFLASLLGKYLLHCGVYANINTKYFFGTSNICFDLIFYTFFLVHSVVCDETLLKILFLWILRSRKLLKEF